MLFQKKIVDTNVIFIPLWIQINRILSHSLEVCRILKRRARKNSCRIGFLFSYLFSGSDSTSGKFGNTRTRSIWNTFSSYLNLLTFSNDSNAIRNITFDHFKILFSEQRVTILHTSNIRSNATHLFFSLSMLILGECYSGCVNRSACRSHFGHIGIDIAICVCSFVRAPCDPVPSQATMLKKTKGKMKRRNTESSMQLALQAAASNDPEPELF